jgi:hypothetical protein
VAAATSARVIPSVFTPGKFALQQRTESSKVVLLPRRLCPTEVSTTFDHR